VSLSAMTGVKQAPVNPPDQATAFPFAIAYVRSGSFQSTTLGNFLRETEYAIIGELHIAKTFQADTIKKAMPYLELFRTQLDLNPTLGGSVDEIVRVDFEFGGMEYGGIPTIGYRFILTTVLSEC